jgi:hypothetical protein
MRKALLLVALALAGTSTALAAPLPVLGDAVIPNAGKLIGDATAYANAVAPGSGQMLGQGRQMLDGAGVDAASPIWIVVFDPKVTKDPLLVVFKEKDAKLVDSTVQGAGLALKRVGGLVVAAKKPLLDQVPDAMVKELTARPVPAKPFARVYLPKVYDAFKKDIEKAEKDMAGGPMGEAFSGGMKMVWGFFKETKELTAELDVSAAQANLFVVMTGKPGSTLAKLGAGAKGSEFRLAQPIAGMPIVGAGTLDLSAMGDLWEGMATMSAKLMGADPKELAKAWRAYALLFSGETGYGMSMKSPTDMRVSFVSEVKDGPAALVAWEGSMTALASGKKAWYEVKRQKGAFTDGGVVADEITLSATANFPKEAQPAAAGARVGIATVVGKTLVGVQAGTSEEARAAMKELLANLKKPPTPSAAMSAAFADAKSRKESLVFFMDPGFFAGMMGKKVAAGGVPFAFGGSGAPDGLKLRLSAPAAAVKALISAK